MNAGHHVVQFYGHDEELAERVAGYLLGAVTSGGVALVIATAAHRGEFEARLRRAGVDLAAAVASGAYLALDAEETVREFMAGDRLDQAGFYRVIGALIKDAGEGGRPVRAYGEMVAMLWDAGLVSAAVQLETLWNELGRRHLFSLFCGYPAGAVTQSGRLDAFAEVCRLHREIVGTSPDAEAPGAVRTFALSRDAPAAARHFAVGALRRWAAEDLADDAALVVTELAANAVVHAHSGFTVALSARRDMLRISVRDASPLPSPEAGPALPPAPLHGLGAVDALASQWGVESLGSAGKTVWVDLRR
jgi:MEDS: MEthanogen/methylotroph, DcmR Sensory domain